MLLSRVRDRAVGRFYQPGPRRAVLSHYHLSMASTLHAAFAMLWLVALLE
jgi:hypothetical protein